MQEQEFYIGWQKSAPVQVARTVRLAVYAMVLLVLLFAVAVVVFQRKFSESIFEFGVESTLQGVLTYQPVPMLILPESGRRVLLVSPGKFGAEKALAELNTRIDGSSEGLPVQVRGSLIYYDGKTAMEVHAVQPDSTPPPVQHVVAPPVVLGTVLLRGEITDPKCYFGVMKPAVGKPHQDCSARCIAGGIPPVLKVANAAGDTEYYLLKDQQGNPINQQVLPFVGSGVEIQGTLQQWGDWLVLCADPATMKRIQKQNLNPESMCR
jgi:hypothetical protein